MDKHVPIGNQSRRPRPTTKPTSQIEVVHVIENIENDKYSLELRFPTDKPRFGTHIIPRSNINSPTQVQKELVDLGVHSVFTNEAGLKQIKEALRKPPVEGKMQETSRTGWHDKSFVWQGGTHGPQHSKLRFQKDKAVKGTELTCGTLKDWKSGLEIPCQSSKILVFALAMGFAAPFLKFVSPNEGATFYIWGITTTGKTLASRALMSIFRRAEEGALMTFDHTDAKLDEEAAAYNDMVLVLNEGERLTKNPKDRAEIMRNIAYKVAGGVGRQRSKTAARINPDLENKKWLVLCLGSGENTVRNAERDEGEEIRLVDIPVPEPHLGGIFNEHGPNEADPVGAGYKMAKATEEAILEDYGVAFEPFMEAVCADLDATVKRVKQNVSLFMKNVAPKADAKTTRMVKKFGIIYAGAIEACRFGVAPWTEQRARDAIAHVCRLALKRIADESAVESAIKKLRAAVQNSRRFPIIEKGESLQSNLVRRAAGFRRSERRQFVAVRPKDLAKIIGRRDITAKVLKRLVDEGILWKDGDKWVRKVQVQGFNGADRDRWYCFWDDELAKQYSTKVAVPSDS